MDTPPDKKTEPLTDLSVLHFMGVDEQNVLISTFMLRNEINLIENVNQLFDLARTGARIPARHALVHSFLVLSQYHLLFSFATLCRCHPEEAFASMRVAIDATLHAYRILEGDANVEQFVQDEKVARRTVSIVREGRKSGSYPKAEHLLNAWEYCSKYASHADFRVIEGKALIEPAGEKALQLLVKFSNAQPEPVQKYLALTLALNFCDILGVYSDHLQAISVVDADWESRRRGLFNTIFDEWRKIQPIVAASGSEADGKIAMLLSGNWA